MTDYLQGTSILLYGPPKVGKTTLLASFPEPMLIFATERRHRFLTKSKSRTVVPIYRGADWGKFKKSIQKVWDMKPKTVAIDTLNNLYHFCFKAKCSSMKIEHPAMKGEFGRSIWHMIGVEFLDVMGELATACDDVDATQILVACQKTVRIELPSRVIDLKTYDLPGQVDRTIPPAVENIWCLDYAKAESEYSDGERVLHLRGNELVRAESGDPALKYSRVPKLPMDGYKKVYRSYEVSYEGPTKATRKTRKKSKES